MRVYIALLQYVEPAVSIPKYIHGQNTYIAPSEGDGEKWEREVKPRGVSEQGGGGKVGEGVVWS